MSGVCGGWPDIPQAWGERVARVEAACRVSAACGPIRDKRSDACVPGEVWGEGVAAARVERVSEGGHLDGRLIDMRLTSPV